MGDVDRPPLDRLTASDRFLMWDDYGWSSDIGAVAILDGRTLLDEHSDVRLDLVREHVAARLHLTPRFRQRLLRPRRGLGWPTWIDAPSFDLADHIRVRRLPESGNEAQLLRVCEELAERPLDARRPLWELWLLPGLSDHTLGAILRVHHVVADGPAALAAFASLLADPAASPTSAPPWHAAAPPTTIELLHDNARRRWSELRTALGGLAHPLRTLRRARGAWPAWREVLADRPAPRTSLNRVVSGTRRMAVVRGDLALAKRIARHHDAKVGDVVLTAVSGGVRRLLESRGELADAPMQRAMVTISQHEDIAGIASRVVV